MTAAVAHSAPTPTVAAPSDSTSGGRRHTAPPDFQYSYSTQGPDPADCHTRWLRPSWPRTQRFRIIAGIDPATWSEAPIPNTPSAPIAVPPARTPVAAARAAALELPRAPKGGRVYPTLDGFFVGEGDTVHFAMVLNDGGHQIRSGIVGQPYDGRAIKAGVPLARQVWVRYTDGGPGPASHLIDYTAFVSTRRAAVERRVASLRARRDAIDAELKPLAWCLEQGEL